MTKFKAPKIAKMAVLILLHALKLISRKISMTGKILKFPHCDSPIRSKAEKFTTQEVKGGIGQCLITGKGKFPFTLIIVS